MLYKPVEYMKKYIVCVTVVMLIMLCGCNKQKATDIVIDNSRYSQTTKADNPYKDQQSESTTENSLTSMEANAVEHYGGVYKCNDSVNISDFEITVQKVIIDKTYDEIELEASQYFKTEWIQKGSLSNYNSENMSLVYVYIKVKNIASNTAECPIGMASIGNYYDDNKYYRLSECAAIYPPSYERTTHCLYDDINAGEEKVYIVLFKVLDNYTDNDGSYSQLLINPCLELEINPATQGKKAPLVILDNISRE